MAGIDDTVRTPDGRVLAFSATGQPDGTPIFYFHGIPGSRLDFQHPFNRPALDETDAWIVGIDRPGYGGSDFQAGRKFTDWPADVAVVADALGIDDFGIVAYSGGAPYAIACALAFPERITRVGIVSGCGPAEMPGFYGGMGRTDALLCRIARWAPAVGRLAVNQAGRRLERSPEKFSDGFDRELSPPDVVVHRQDGMRDAVRAAFREAVKKGPRGIIEDYRIWFSPKRSGLLASSGAGAYLAWRHRRDRAAAARAICCRSHQGRRTRDPAGRRSSAHRCTLARLCFDYGRASSTRLKGVSVARRKRVKPPPSTTTSRSRASPA